jgi:hypothetical protein
VADIFGIEAAYESPEVEEIEGHEEEAAEAGPDQGHPENPEEGAQTTEGNEPDQPQAAAPETPPQAPEQQPKRFAGKYETPEELEAAYANMQQLLGRQAQELGQARALLMQQQIQLMPSQPQQQAAQQQPETTPEEWAEKFFSDPRSVIQQEVQQALMRQSQEIGTAMSQVLGPVQQVVQEYRTEKMQREYEAAATALENDMKAKYPDWDNYRQAMADYDKYLVDNGMGHIPMPREVVYQIVKARDLINQQANAATQAAAAQTNAAKLAAGAAVAAPSGAAPDLNAGQLTPEESIRSQIFNFGESKGIFSD